MTRRAQTHEPVVRALLVDDEPEDHLLTRALLARAQRTRVELDGVRSYREALEMIGREEHDVYLVDYFLADRTGLDLVREIVRRRIRAPVIMLTGRGNEDVDVEAMRAGAADYLVKGRVDPWVLERSIRYALQRQQAAEALVESEARNRSTFEQIPTGLFRCATDGRFLDANPALQALLGYPDPELMANAFARHLFVAPEDTERFRAAVLAAGRVLDFASHLRRADGRDLTVRTSAWVHRSRVGAIEYLEGTVVADATHRREPTRENGDARSEPPLRLP